MYTNNFDSNVGVVVCVCVCVCVCMCLDGASEVKSHLSLCFLVVNIFGLSKLFHPTLPT